jgi:hypothetical protein
MILSVAGWKASGTLWRMGPARGERSLAARGTTRTGVTGVPLLQPSAESQLVALESVDVVREWHTRLCGRQLSARRAAQIVAAARQAREYMRNASSAGYTVRPLLTYYANASLARALVLLLRRSGGEETLSRGHGIETVGWSDLLATDTHPALPSIFDLRARVTAGLFQDLVDETENTICIHVQSSAVDWRLAYPKPSAGLVFTLGDVATRLPDLKPQQSPHGPKWRLAAVSEMTYSDEAGFVAKAKGGPLSTVKDEYVASGYAVQGTGGTLDLVCPVQTFKAALPQLTHSYLHKTFGSIPDLYLAPPLASGARLSQIGLTLALSYMLGMLTRYFPTHWMALQSGTSGDGLWPVLFVAQEYVENTFPELVLEFLFDRLTQAVTPVPTGQAT